LRLLRNNNFKNKENARHILKLRYAKGEITKKEYEDMKKELVNKSFIFGRNNFLV